jgi:hypothetical protein
MAIGHLARPEETVVLTESWRDRIIRDLGLCRIRFHDLFIMILSRHDSVS